MSRGHTGHSDVDYNKQFHQIFCNVIVMISHLPQSVRDMNFMHIATYSVCDDSVFTYAFRHNKFDICGMGVVFGGEVTGNAPCSALKLHFKTFNLS